MAYGQKNNNQFAANGAKKPFNPPQLDHLIEVVEINGVAGTILGKSHIGKLGLYKISLESMKRNGGKPARADNDQVIPGFRIDSKMEKAYKPGRKLVMEKAKWTANVKVNGQDVSCYDINWVHNSTAQAPHKLFPGVFTAVANKDMKLAAVQSWVPTAFAATDKEALKAFCDKLDAVAAEFETNKNVGKLGLQIRALWPGVSDRGEPMWICRDSTIPMDKEEAQETDSEERKFPPMTKASVLAHCRNYASYLKNQYPTFIEDGCQIDIMTYQVYVHTTYTEKIAKDWLPEAKMTQRVTKTAADGEVVYKGKNVAVKGILELTKDGEDEATGNRVVRNIAQKLHCNNKLMDARSAVASFDGKYVQVDESIRTVISDFKSGQEIVDAARALLGGDHPHVQSMESILASREAPAPAAPADFATASWDDNPFEDDPFAELPNH